MGAMDKETATAKILEFIQQMPSLSTTATKVLQVCNTPAPAPNDLNRVISLDPVLAAKVLKLINSAYYARRNKITSLTRAIIMLGINTIKNLVLSTAIVNCVSDSTLSKTMDMNLFWSHSIQVGVTARLIAKEMGIPALDQEFFFLAGLMHDLGKVPMSNQFPEWFDQALALCRNNQIDICLAEKQLMGLAHCDIGQMIVKKWDLGDVIESAFTSHHNMRVGMPDEDRIGWIIELADMYARLPRHAKPGETENISSSIPPEMALLNEKTGVSHEKLVTFDDTIFVEMEIARAFLNL